MGSASNDRQGLSVTTLAISSLAALLAAVIVSLFWERGTLIATAVTPVIVALVSEGLAKPADKLEEAASSVVAKTPLGDVLHDHDGAGGTPDELRPGDAPADPALADAAEKPDPAAAEPTDHGTRNRRIVIALITGVLAFIIAAVVLTGTEMATGGSLGTSNRTTLFGGSSNKPKEKEDGGQTDQPSDSTGRPEENDQPDEPDRGDGETPRQGQPETTPPEQAPLEETPSAEPGQEPPGDEGEAQSQSGAETAP